MATHQDRRSEAGPARKLARWSIQLFMRMHSSPTPLELTRATQSPPSRWWMETPSSRTSIAEARTMSTSRRPPTVTSSYSLSRTWWLDVASTLFGKYCTARGGYHAKAFKPPKWDSTGHLAGKLYCTHQQQSVNERSTCFKIIYDKHLHGRNLAMIGARWMGPVYANYAAVRTRSITSSGSAP